LHQTSLIAYLLYFAIFQGSEVTSQHSFSFEVRPTADGATWQIN